MSEAKYYKSVKTNAIAELVGKNEHGVILLLDNGEERVLAQSTLKRWWVEVEAPTTPKTVKSTLALAEVTTPEDLSEFTGLHKQFMNAIKKLLETSGTEMFYRETTKTYNLTSNNTIYLWFKLTRNNINVFVKSKAVGTDFVYTPVNHNFDMKIVFTEWNSKSYNTVRKLHDLSLNFQNNKKKK